ncbi:AraC family transcriptional regulator [Gluconobacter sphaericus]|uniref:AraC family transcriptional regulator n=1 Tax=Gluconobacter sphaericus TaxID=574987 RepID=UPI001B8AC490|nr:helix-turn-helix transcriptional regulator [Gluconobacter sphaericus]MBS1086003.1 helix-turn-helix transcriptional regulator [Gluconobacter sphaericus]MBS1099601.1 helix-turn-helix transcriptional regulator [Gluconobacter sphaericus]
MHATIPLAVPMPSGSLLVAAMGRQSMERTSPPHRHSEGQLLGSLKGLLTVGTDAGLWIVPTVHAVWFPPNTVHWNRSHGPMEGWTVYISEEACRNLPSQACTIRNSGLLLEAVVRAASWKTGPYDEASHRIARVILDEISTLPSEDFCLPFPRDPRVKRVAQALIDNPSDARDVKTWASWAAVSERTLSRRFVQETGFSFRTYRQRARLLRSLEMLAEGQSVNLIALDLGYATASAFIAVFSQVFGKTPAAYREKMYLRGNG